MVPTQLYEPLKLALKYVKLGSAVIISLLNRLPPQLIFKFQIR